jgi:class 3 adenylate cyclase
VPLADHAEAAVRAALEMLDLIELFNVEQQAAGKPAIRIGVGIATGEMVAGYTGTQQRATYTCIGDTVNLAARLEQHTKDARRTILIDGATRAALGDDDAQRVAIEALGEASFRGKAAPVAVFALG